LGKVGFTNIESLFIVLIFNFIFIYLFILHATCYIYIYGCSYYKKALKKARKETVQLLF
jgi:hypothetical protein